MYHNIEQILWMYMQLYMHISVEYRILLLGKSW